MSVDRFESLLAEGLYFAAAAQFDDAFEGAITEAEETRRQLEAERMYPEDGEARDCVVKQLSGAFEDLRRMTMLSCWHESTGHENVAMWDRYVAPDTAGVAVVSTAHQLKASLLPFRLAPDYGEEPIVVGRVRYIDYANETMDDRTMLGIFMHKRIEYRDEREVRAILSLRMADEFGVAIPNGGAFVDVDLAVLISEVRLSPSAKQVHEERVKAMIAEYDLNCGVARSSLSKKPTY